jgi:FkbM family methyltransferase
VAGAAPEPPSSSPPSPPSPPPPSPPSPFLARFDRELGPLLGVRGPTFRRVFELLEARAQPFFTIVETGISNLAGPDGRPAHHALHGHSTLLFDQFVSAWEGVVYSIDRAPAHCARARAWVGDKVRIFCHDSRVFLAGFQPPTPVDCLYLDSADIDWADPHPGALHVLEELCAILPRLPAGCIVLVDDSVRGVGSAGYIVEVMDRIGATPLFDEYQVAWRLERAPPPAIRPWGRYDAAELAFLLSRAAPRRYRYVRPGVDERVIHLLPDGRVGHGLARDEDRWFAEARADGRVGIVLGGAGRVTARLAPAEEEDAGADLWRGRRLVGDREAVELRPLPAARDALPAGRYQFRRGRHDAAVIELGAEHDVTWGRGAGGETWRVERDARDRPHLVLAAAGVDVWRLAGDRDGALWRGATGDDGGGATPSLEPLGEVRAGERAARDALAAQRHFRYLRAGDGEWPIELLPGGAIGRGATPCEAAWDTDEDDGGDVSLLLRARDGTVTRLVPREGGRYEGRWPLGGEAVALEPIAPSTGAYLLPVFTACLPRDRIRTVVEVGAGDGADSAALQSFFDADVYAFECNPDVLPACAERIGGNRRVTLVAKAVGERDGLTTFFPVTNGNRHASSCFRANPAYPYERYVQDRCEVDMVRLDGWLAGRGVDAVDLLAVDTQGGCLQVLRGMGGMLERVRFIIAELDTRPVYDGEALAPDAIAFLAERGFHLLRSFDQWGVLSDGTPVGGPAFAAEYAGAESWFGDYLFVRPTAREAAEARVLTARRRFRYVRLGHDARVMELLPGGQIGAGRAPCERHWRLDERADGAVELLLIGLDQVTCRLRPGSDGRWRGRWISHERMPVILEPLEPDGAAP